MCDGCVRGSKNTLRGLIGESESALGVKVNTCGYLTVVFAVYFYLFVYV